jgi:hypothetical protein
MRVRRRGRRRIARHRAQELPLQGYLAALARTLHGELEAVVVAGCSPVPAALITARADETLRNVIRYLQEVREREEAAAGPPPREVGEKGGKHR